MRMILITCCLSFISNAFCQPNNGVTFINNLPNMTVGQSMEIIIDGNGGGYMEVSSSSLEGIYNLAIEKWILNNGNWIFVTDVMTSGTVGWLEDNKMIVKGVSPTGNNPCFAISGEDLVLASDDDGNDATNTICVYESILPIMWHLLTAKLQNNQTQITWSIATQINNEKYIIEQSTDGRNFSPIGEMAANGTSNETKHYEYIHTSPSIGINYYRIKQVDYDGKYSYSDIASVRYEGHGEISIYPNPATSDVTITTTASISLQIMDVYGRVLTKQEISEGQNTINLSSLPSGILIFVVGDQRYKVLKE